MREAQARVDSQEFAGWLAYWTLEPWGEERADLRAAIVACVIANAFRGKGKRRFKPQDFMPKFGPEEKKGGQSAQEQFAIMKAICSVFAAAAKKE